MMMMFYLTMMPGVYFITIIKILTRYMPITAIFHIFYSYWPIDALSASPPAVRRLGNQPWTTYYSSPLSNRFTLFDISQTVDICCLPSAFVVVFYRLPLNRRMKTPRFEMFSFADFLRPSKCCRSIERSTTWITRRSKFKSLLK